MSKLLRALSCGTLGRRRRTMYNIDEQNKPTAKNDAKQVNNAGNNNNDDDVDNFWNIDGYESAIERCNDGNELCENLISMLNDRARVEENYAKELKQWKKKWSDFLNKESKEYGTTKIACMSMLQTADNIAEHHLTLHTSLIDKTKSPVTEIRNWMKKNYAVEHIHFRKRNEFMEQFKYAQKPWADYFKELKKCETKYHESFKQSIELDQNAKKAEKNPKVKEEERVKLRKEAEKAVEEQKKELNKYKNHLELANKFKANYETDMKKVFDRTQEFEILRMNFFKDIYTQFKACFVSKSLYDAKLKEQIFDDLTKKLEKMKPEDDVKWWSDNYGAGMKPVWPSFVEYSN